MGSTSKNKKINGEAYMRKGYFLMVTILIWLYIAPVFSQQGEINKGNLNERILEAYNQYEETDDYKLLADIIDYIIANNPKIQEDRVRAVSFYLRAIYYFHSNELVETKAWVDSSLKLAQELNYSELSGLCIHLLSLLDTFDGDLPEEEVFRKSREAKLRAIKLLESTGRDVLLVDPFRNLMNDYDRFEDWENVLKYGNKLLEVINKTGKKTSRIRHIYLYMAKAEIKLGRIDQGKNHLDMAKGLTSKMGIKIEHDTYFLSRLHGIYASLYKELGDADKIYENNLKSKDYLTKYFNGRLEEAEHLQKRERDLKDQLNASRMQTIREHRWLLMLSGLFLTLSVFYVIYIIKLYRRLRISHKEAKKLNYELQQSLVKLQTTNMDLRKKQEHIVKLMELNERTLFSKVLKISTYNDTIANMAAQISKLIENSKPVPPNKLFQMERTMIAMVDEDEIWSDFQIQFEKTRPNFFKKLKKLSPSFSVSELKHCSYVVSQLRTKDVARLINVSPRTVETARYRIKKKLGLDKDDSLYDYLQKI